MVKHYIIMKIIFAKIHRFGGVADLNFDGIVNEKNEAIEKIFENCVAEAKTANRIPAEAFDSYKVKKGLREKDGTGVMAGVTNIGNAHGYVVYDGEKIADEGKLEYRGMNLVSLIDGFRAEDRFGFEECVYLLLSLKPIGKRLLDAKSSQKSESC